jgi:hypothetical protein
MTKAFRILTTLMIAAMPVASVACGDDDPTGPTAETLSKISGDQQQAAKSTALAAPFVVRVLDDDGDPMTGVTVTWAVTAGGGTLSATTTTTAATGNAQVTLTLGAAAGNNTVTATVAGLTAVTFSATAQ